MTPLEQGLIGIAWGGALACFLLSAYIYLLVTIGALP